MFKLATELLAIQGDKSLGKARRVFTSVLSARLPEQEANRMRTSVFKHFHALYADADAKQKKVWLSVGYKVPTPPSEVRGSRQLTTKDYIARAGEGLNALMADGVTIEEEDSEAFAILVSIARRFVQRFGTVSSIKGKKGKGSTAA